MTRITESGTAANGVDLSTYDRAGRLACFCPPGSPVIGQEHKGVLWRLSLGFGCAVLAQTLVSALLPLSGLMLAPQPYLIPAPYMAMILGAAAATFPASYLLDAFGRKASFALGASHGLAGGLVLAWALSHHSFYLLLLGAFWLGIAQGFSLFYRHEAAIGHSAREAMGRIILVFGSGALAGILGPALLFLCAQKLSDHADVLIAIVAACAQIAVLFLAVSTAAPQTSSDAPMILHHGGWRFWAPTLCAASAWFGMTQTMLSMPSAMTLCGIAQTSIFGVMAWHVLMMYAPAFAVYPLARRIGAPLIALFGLVLIALAHESAARAQNVIDFSFVLGALALGWSLATTAATLWLHRDGSPSRWMLAGHDGLLFLAALFGAFASAPVPLGLI